MDARENAGRRDAEAGHCAGCRFNCSIERLQCGRGVMLERGVSPSERGRDGAPGAGVSQSKCDYKRHLPAEARLAHVLSLAAERLTRDVPRTDEQRLAGILHRHSGFMSLRMLAAQSQLDAERHEAALASLAEDGLVTVEDREPCGPAACLTSRGEHRARQWRDDYDANCAKFAALLSPDERQQLVSLLFKLLG